jgi:hypothetical protein
VDNAEGSPAGHGPFQARAAPETFMICSNAIQIPLIFRDYVRGFAQDLLRNRRAAIVKSGISQPNE